MSEDSILKLHQILDLPHGHLDEDLSIALNSLITSAVRDEDSPRTLQQAYDAICRSDSIASLEPLTLLPLLAASRDENAERLVRLMAESSSAKEVVMATQEVVETIELMSQSSEQYDDEQDSAPPFQQLACILMVYSLAIPRLPRRKQTPSEVLRPLFAELGSVVSHTASDAMPSDHRKLITSTVRTVSILNRWMASESSHDSSEHDNVVDVLYSLLTTVVEACANNIDSHLAQQAFQRQFPRLVVPFSDGDSSTQSEDITRELQTAIADLHLTPSRLQAEPTLGSLILLAHTPSYTFTTSLLTAFFAVILMALQTNHALDEVLALLIDTIVPFRAYSPASDFPPDLLIPLAHILSSLASVHPDSATRHHTFRLLASILALAPSPLRLQLLHELLTDEDTAPQMRVAAIGLVKDALLEALAAPAGSEESSRNVFASHLLLRTLGPILLQPHPPSLFDTANQLDQQDFLDTAEPLRLVECLALCYVWLLRDVQNRTGLRDADNLRNVEHTLLEPLRRQLRTWDNDSGGSVFDGEHAAMQLAILDMWLGRVADAVQEALHECS